jgi:hypothetical protein
MGLGEGTCRINRSPAMQVSPSARDSRKISPSEMKAYLRKVDPLIVLLGLCNIGVAIKGRLYDGLTVMGDREIAARTPACREFAHEPTELRRLLTFESQGSIIHSTIRKSINPWCPQNVVRPVRRVASFL